MARPQVVSNYFKYCNVVDLHNQARQFDLALEKKWVTQNGYFRLYTTMLGMAVTDLWKTMSKSFYKSNRQYTITKFADILARDMVEYAQQLEEQEDIDELGISEVVDSTASSTLNPVTQSTSNDSGDTAISSVTCTIGKKCFGVHEESSLVHTPELLPTGKQVRCIWCSRVGLIERKTTMRCKQCKRGFCRDKNGTSCWSAHVAYGGIPPAPLKGTRKRKVKDSLTPMSYEEV